MPVQIQFRRDTESNWTSNNPTLASGEMGIETDTDQFKIGDGSTVWSSLAYGGIVGPAGVTTATSPLAYNAGTQTVSIDLSAYDTSTEVDGKITALVDSAPGTLDTLNELAAALGDDANFATTVTNSLAGKQAIVSGVSDTEIGYLDGVSSAIQTQLDTKALLTPAVNAKTGSYSLVVGDSGEFITCSGTFSITIPSGTFAAGDRVDFVNIGTGVITFTGSGVTINSVDAAVTIDTQWAGATFFFTSSTAGVLVGKLA
jgi:hypothetical protein